MTGHPPHLVSVHPSTQVHDQSLTHIHGNLTFPSALIPFCSILGNMSISSEYIQDLSFPVCTAFLPVILEGQLCFRINQPSLNLLSQHGGAGVQHSLMLLLDTNTERSSAILQESEKSSLIEFETITPESDLAQIHIETLSPFTGLGPGHYQMKVLKQTTGSNGFLSLPDHKKKCQEELREDCEIRVWEEAVLSHCHCYPFTLVTASKHKVSHPSSICNTIYLH